MNDRTGGLNIKSKKGSSAVFLTVIMAAIMSIALALIYGVKTETAKSSIDAVINLAGDSVMSEFDRKLQKEYGLFLIKGTDEELSRKLDMYVKYSLDDMEDVMIDAVDVSAGRYPIISTSNIKEQIIEHMKARSAEGIVDSITGKEKGNTETDAVNQMEERTLRYGPAISSLPSATIPKKSLTAMAESLADKADDVKAAFVSGTETYMISNYILGHFNSGVHIADNKHFFKNEVEYILGGELSDKKNEKRVEMALKAMRFPINMAYLYADPEKQAALAAAAQIMTPGPAAVATQAALTSTWAYAEADNDVELLKKGNKVPMVKDSSTWAIDLDSAIEGVFGGTVIPSREKGYDYGQYLQILLFFQDENIKIARIMDLIQINMRKNYDKDFLINEYATGISVRVKVNGKMYSYEKQY
ncbi:MAG: hypothetical protein IJB14_00500 [Firmicutes bacterium]|nr:hypothetical protein [Bacillota bacterium]